MNFLNEREESVLKTIIEEFVQSNEPVGSRLISKTGPLKLGPASIRNIMSDLEEKGYILQPHTSAGRVPSDEGYRYYIDRLVTFSFSDRAILEQLKQECSAENINGVFKKVSDNLSRLTRSVGFVISPKLNTMLLKHIEFVRLSGTTVLAVIVAKTGIVHNVMLDVTPSVTDSDLVQISNYLNTHFIDKSLMEVKTAILDEMRKDKNRMDSLVKNVMTVTERVFGNSDFGQDIILSGTSTILDLPEFSDVSKLKGLFQTFEEKKFIFDILDKCQNETGVNIFIGSEIGRSEVSELGLVTKTYSRGGNVIGMLGIIGPKRMRYSDVVSVVDCSADLVTGIMGKFLESK
ncbi:heat-inducible transcriptional repressor HrcA [Seleniivibrio woodruffii]|uniref:Heat-inducible transcription repressor HrcA n=1 Tax=Seleniivibrio woodruffii TaxID=1078050 RepID=A0A4V2PS87_9BACT|nr:heat-inducible transcriptional repressor HrcA [Seleniivibrio woodruffii]TCK61771.1 heat-inducible transcription repressor HrcA [Seleniivibrio woodruffii]TVZ35114.1 heat-inducible transcription repressor HrcA [Seleniivibrio woodruffii]